MAQKYFDQIEATKKVQEGVKTAEKATVAALKQRDQIQNEYTKSLLAQTKLEGICRELQRHNKEIKVGRRHLFSSPTRSLFSILFLLRRHF